MAPEPNEYDIELSAYVKLTRAESALQGRILDHHPLSAGMTLSQFGVLEALLHKGRLSHHDAARKILKTPGNITSVVDQLERS
ncbi:MAG: MarR family transcriptional regulator, partial [Spirochaetota bacterium]